MGDSDSGPAEDKYDVSNTFSRALIVLAVLHLAAFVGVSSDEPIRTGSIVVWIVTLVSMPVLGYFDLRRVRAVRPHWRPKANGLIWIIGLVIPFVSPSVVVTYLLRRRELIRHDRYWIHAAGGGIAIILAGMALFIVAGDPSIVENTPLETLGVTLYGSFTLLPGLATYFDIRYLLGNDRRLYDWLWVLTTATWFVQVPVFVGYVVWRSRNKDPLRKLKRIEFRVRSIPRLLEEGRELVESGDHQTAIDKYEEANESLDSASSRVDRLSSSLTGQSRIRDMNNQIKELREEVDVRRPVAEAEHKRQLGQTQLDNDEYGLAIDTFEAAIEQYEKALERTDDEDVSETLQAKLPQIHEEYRTARDQFVTEEFDPLADSIESSYADGQDALSEGDYREAIDYFNTAFDRIEELDARLKEYDLDYEPPVSRGEIADALATADRKHQRARIESKLAGASDHRKEANSAIKEDEHDRAIDLLETARGELDAAESLIEQSEFDEWNIAERRENLVDDLTTAERKRRRSRIESKLANAEDHRQEGESAIEDGNYQHAVNALETAREELDTAESLIEQTELDEWDIKERHSTIGELHKKAVEQNKREKFDFLVERGDTYREEAMEAGDDGQYGEAVDSCEAAHDAYEEALQVAEESEAGDTAVVQKRLDDVSELRSDYRIKALSQRVRDAQAASDEDDREQYLAAVADLNDLITELEELDIDRERDIEIVEEEAQRERIRARLLAERERARGGVESFEAGDYETARDRFEATRESVEEIRAEAEEAEVTEYDDAIDQLQSACERNADTARRSILGMAENPSVVPIDLPLGDSSRGITTPMATPGATTEQRATPKESFDGSLQSELPTYEEVGHIGSGGNADVYEVRLESGDNAALKLPRWQGTLSTAMVEEFANEADTWSKLDQHDHVVSLLEWGENPYPWMLLEYLPASIADRMEAFDIQTTVDVLIGVADALEFAHGRGVVHLDIKPENVLLTENDSPKVGDWGLSQVVLEHTQTQMGLTPPYSAPEQLSEEYGSVDRRTDVYQLSVLAYQMLTGELPFAAERPADLQRLILNEDPTPPSAINPALDPAVDDILTRGLSKDPADRYRAVVLLRNALETLPE